ncbi:MAG: transglutaminase family protein [Hyphomonadaceae bacterium]|nr:transglutaminase family protein [Hyphomonadaceae bacterium]
MSANEDALHLSDSAWAALNALGEQVDADLAAQKVRLTMGGEPTFVAADDPHAPEWSLAAIGPTKATYADTLLRRLRERFAPDGLMHHGKGKHYPGEALPRWAYSLFWRADGKPIWRDAARIAHADAPEANAEDARSLVEAIAAQLDVPKACIIAAYEDPDHWLRRQAELPINLKPGDPRLAGNALHASVARALAKGLQRVAAFVLPLGRERDDAAPSRWRSQEWRFRRGALVLIPGEMPAGDRLPLASLPWLHFDEFPLQSTPDPSEERDALPDRPRAAKDKPASTKPVRTALTVEAREGKLWVFMPPLERLEHYLELLTAIEDAAGASKLPLRLEGYPPPADPRLRTLSVTPDPGVIEVNVHAATSWREGVAITVGVYEDARAIGLTAEKFHTDGRHASTGGGNHIVFGAAHPSDSPFLRRPDLLKSILIYFQHHPSLSYFFSGQYVGPSSQAPRVDEARHEALYELELALARIPAPDEEAPPWLIDRLLRNLLADMAGNTHRAEVCIDKLFSPYGAMGRLGLVEFRAFEMAPEARMCAAEQLLLRALIAWFWRAPLDAPLIRWGTALADQFMLPEFLWADFQSVLADLHGAGYAFDDAWFAPQRAFRFPEFGAFEAADAAFTVRQALEPWHVLAEHYDDGGVSRPVDSSLSRIEVAANGFDPTRHLIACNGRALPMTLAPSGRHAAGVRFKARKLERGLHPTIEPHLPLALTVFDRGKAVASFSFDAAKRSDAPASRAAADRRRRAQLKPGPAPNSPPPPQQPPSAEFPTTLDLRRND